MTGLHISPDLTLPLELVTEPIGILANRGRGKSYSTHVLVEEIHDAGVPVVVLDVKGDWWGLRTAADGKRDGLPFYIFGGDHEDVPLEPTAGELLADLVVNERVSVVLDLSHMSKTKARSFTVAFAERLYHRNRDPLFVVVDEADVLIPQRATAETARLIGAMEDIAKRGRGRGIGMAVVTQRPQEVAKSVLDLMDTLLLLGMTGPRSLKSIEEWTRIHVDAEDGGDTVMGTLPKLPVGTAWVWSPMHDILERIKVRRIRTFDSHATPKPGERRVAPAGRVDLDLTKLGEQIAETREAAKANDPRHLRQMILNLETDNATLRRELETERLRKPEPERVEVPVLAPEVSEGFAKVARELIALGEDIVLKLGPLRDERIQQLERDIAAPAPRRGGLYPPVKAPPPKPARPLQPARADVPVAVSSDVQLRAGARRMVESLGRMAPLHLTISQWGTVAKLKTTGGTWSTYLGELRRAGLVEEHPNGWTLSDAGFDYLGGRPDPMTAEELQAHYRTILRAGAVRMLDAIMDQYPDGLSKEELGDAAGISTAGGTFSTYLGELVRNGLAENRAGVIVATDILMRGANA